MKIRQWFGYNEDASEFLLRPGELSVLNNLQPRRPGMLIARSGLTKRYGRYNNELIAGMYRRATVVGSQADFLWMIKSLVEKELTIEEIDQGVYPFESIWSIKRIQGDKERIIDTFDLAPFGTPIYNFCVAEDRHGRLFLFYGHGVRPRIYRPSNIANNALPLGIDPPQSQPSVSPTGLGYFLESVDVLSGGGTYNEPPPLEVIGGDADRPAKVKAIIENGSVVGVDIIDGGNNYDSPPRIEVGQSDMGVGFRAKAEHTDNAYTMTGFASNDQGTVSNALQEPNEFETYGTKNGTDGQGIMYLNAEGVLDYVDAKYNSTQRRYTARIPLTSSSSTGLGAAAYVQFSPLPLGYALNTSSVTDSITTVDSQFQQYNRVERGRGNEAIQKGSRDFLYGDYWEGTEYNVKNSRENKTYGGLQASGERFVKGWSGSISGKQADVYWPDYRYISVWYNTGTAGDNSSQWVREDVLVQTETNIETQTTVKYIEVTLKPRANSKEVATVNGLSTTTNYKIEEGLPDATPPKVRINLADCPDSWVIDGPESYPTSIKESQGNRLPWWSSSSGVPRPLVDVPRNEEGRPDDASVSIVDGGSGWAKDTTFAIRLYQANAYEQKVDYNTAVSEEFYNAAHSRGGNYVEFQFKTNAPDLNTPHGPPHTLLEPVLLAVPGDGYTAADTGSIELYKRNINAAAPVGGSTGGATAAGDLILREGFYDESPNGLTVINNGVQLVAAPEGLGNYSFLYDGNSKWETAYDDSTHLDGDKFTIEFWLWRNGSQADRATVLCTAENATSTNWQISFNFGNVLYFNGFGSVNTGPLVDMTWYHVAIVRDGNEYRMYLQGNLVSSTTAGGIYSYPTAGIRSGQNRGADRYFNGRMDDIRIVKGQALYSDNFSPTPISYSASTLTDAEPAQTVSWSARTLQTMTGRTTGSITNINILSGGFGYEVAPKILTRGGRGGYGLKVLPTVENGSITSVKIIDPGLGYTSDVELYTDSSPARLVSKMRPALRGTYRCAFRYVDRTDQILKSIKASLGDSETTLLLSDAEDVTADMILESSSLPHNARIISVKGNEVEINQPITDMVRGHEQFWVGYAGVSDVFNDQYANVVLNIGETLQAGTQVYSPDVEYMCEVQATGRFVLWKRTLNPGTHLRPPYYEYVTPVFDTVLLGYSLDGCVDARLEYRDTGQLVLVGVLADGSEETIWSEDGGANTLTLELSNSGAFATYTLTQEYDVTVRDLTKPVAYSDLSPIVDVECGPTDDRTHASKLTWTLTGVNPPERADKVELWRTSGDQSLVFYRVEAYGVPRDGSVEIIGEDTLTDEELFDPDRPHYGAMPVVLPNGAVNAYRFGKPRDDMSVGVAFQDRLWMGVSTSGEAINTLYYSEFDEFESMPDINELPIQNNQKSTDSLTALVPFGSMLLCMQHNHTYALTYNSDPGLDASIQMLSHRGCLHQRAWDVHENILYAVDESGVYSMSRNGEVKDISLPLRDLFVTELLDFTKRETFFLQVDPRTHILRFFTILLSNPTETPSIALCYDIQAQNWWTETYPNGLTSSCTCRPSDIRRNTILLGSVDGNMYEFDGHQDHNNYSLTDTYVAEGGSGYREAPEITVPNVVGATVQGVVSEGRLVDVVIQGAGWDAKQGINFLTEDGTGYIADASTRNIQGAEYAPIPLDIGPPDAGGIQATAYANFSVTPIVRRFATVSKGENFVRLDPLRVTPFEPDAATSITTENGEPLLNIEGTHVLRTQPPIVEAGMEAVGDFIPLNSFVSHVERNNVYLVHPDGTPVEILGGEPRTNEPGTTEAWLENGGTRVYVRFYKPANTHIPFRMATGFMQRINEDVDARAAGEVERSFTLLYNPTHGDKTIELLERFNGREELVPNLIRRERGGPASFVHREDSASTTLNINREASGLGFSTGVAKAKFASRAIADLTGSDQYVKYELYGRPDRSDQRERLNFWNTDNTVSLPQPLVIHSITVEGVVADG